MNSIKQYLQITLYLLTFMLSFYSAVIILQQQILQVLPSSHYMQKSHQLLVLLLIIIGACNTIFLALQNRQRTPAADPNVKFFHPFIQAAVMFLGESLCFIPYLIYKSFKPKKNEFEVSGFMKLECPVYLPLIPGIMDLLASTLAYISLNLIAGSVWQISRGGVIITTAIFSRICLKKSFTKASLVGCALAFLGITLVQLFEILLKQDDGSQPVHSTSQQIIGVLLLLTSLVFNTIHLIVQKMIFNKYNIHPLKMVFLQGMYGFIGICLIIFTLNFVTCPDIGTIKDKCIISNGNYYIENLPVFVQQISKNTVLLMFIIGLLFSIAISVPLAVTISKVINPVSRSLADVCRTVLIWGFCLTLTATIGKQDDQYKLQETDTLLNLLKLIGFAMVITGTLIYHQVIKIFKDKADDIKQSLLLSEEGADIDNYHSKSSSTEKIKPGSPTKKDNQSQKPRRESLM